MKKFASRVVFAVVVLLYAVGAIGQAMTVSGSHVQDAAGNACANCRITFAPVDLSGRPISFRIGGGGQVQSNPVSANVTNGAFSLVLPDVNATNPQNVCFKTTVVDRNSGVTVLGPLGYTCVQPSSTIGGWCSGSTCNFDQFIPNTPGLPVQTIGGGGNPPSGTGLAKVSGGAWTTTVSAPSGAIVGTTDTQALTNKTLDGVTPTTMGYLDATSSVQSQLSSKASLASPALTGTPSAPTASPGTNSTQLATTAFVLANGSGGTTISNVVFTPTDAATIVAHWTTSSAADSFAYCGGMGAVDNGVQVGVTSHEAIITGLIANSAYQCHVTSAGVSSAPQSVVTASATTRTPILSASMGAVTITSYEGDTPYNFLSSDNNTYLALDDAGSPLTSSSMGLTKVTNESSLTLSAVNGLTNYGAGGTTNGTDGPGGAALSYKQSGLFGMGGCLYMFSSRNLYSTGGTVPQTVYFGNVTADNCNHGATWNNHQAPATFNANGSPDGPGISMFSDSTNQAWCSPVRFAADDGTNGYLTAGNEIDGANAFVYTTCTDGQWNNSSHLWQIRTPRAVFGTLTAGNVSQWWCGPTSPTPADFVNPANWSYSSACRVAIYSAAGQTSAADEVFVPGFNYYVLEEWYQTTTGDPSSTVWNILSGPTPAGPFTTNIYNNTFSPAGWYNESFLHRPIANNTSASSVTADIVFSGNYGSGSATYYHPSYATMTLQALASQTVGTLITPSGDLGSQYVGVVQTAFTHNGHLSSFSFQNFTSYTGTINVGACTDDGSENFTFGNYVTVTSGAGTALQTFNAPGDFTTVAITTGQHPCYWAVGGNGVAKGYPGGVGLFYSNSPTGTLPSGPFGVAPFNSPNGIALTETISIP